MNNNTIVLASGNRGKLKELQHLCADLKVSIVPQQQFNITAVEETGTTFIENALLKARHVTKLTGLPAIADDSGLIIDVLNGAPGVCSARYAGGHGNNIANNEKVLQQMATISQDKRSARFHCCLVWVRHTNDPHPIVCQADWEGEILKMPQGQHGFGYDPIFYVPSHHCSAAELEPKIKNTISHRAQAMSLLKQVLLKELT